ncbi:1,2-dihydroxy-3-keto-5-methylthiopentene dioxygenase [Hahella sp. NBU794]|uniref:1,2-dihydroxy-3-keto-5-methylthiopentene dioxygenase n=1 Tax=Hahella sp. NBU794 TaxID=3422590 RepID=UPI003D6E6D5D
MSSLRIYNDNDFSQPLVFTEDGAEISRQLNEVGIRFERWCTRELEEGATPDSILAAYQAEVEKLKAENGFTTADVVSLTPTHPQKDDFRKKFLDEHRHSEDEVRFFVRGQGLFYLHLDDKVYVVLCRKNDLISVPNGTRHWFDMGPAPEFTCVRLFTNPEGWVAQFTGDEIASKAPRFEQLIEAA